MSARWRRAIFSNPIRMSAARTHGVAGRLPHRARRRCATTGEAAEGVGDEVRSADPLSVNPGQRPGREDEEICTAGRCRCRCSAGVCQRRRSAAHLCRADVPRRCRGLTEDVTACAVILRLWSSSASPKRRVMVGRLCPMRPPLSRRANGVMMQWRICDAP